VTPIGGKDEGRITVSRTGCIYICTMVEQGPNNFKVSHGSGIYDRDPIFLAVRVRPSIQKAPYNV
jgi:hypothetical protein